MLEAVKHSLGCGAIYFQKEHRSNHTTCYRYEVNNRTDIKEKLFRYSRNISYKAVSVRILKYSNPLHLWLTRKYI